jgi:ubiquinone/menaquinone biosynthesis C-methylase UbiE
MPKKNIFSEISRYWSAELNNEVYFKGVKKEIPRGSKEYFDFILKSREKYVYYFKDIADFFNQVKKPGRDRLLEVGCGMGTDLIRFSRLKFKCFGIDLADNHIELARKLFRIYGQKAVVRKGNAEKLAFPAGSFDFVYSFGVLHHTPHPQTAIDELYRILKPGGRGHVMLYHKHSLNNLVHLLLKSPFENPRGTNKVARDAHFVYRFSKAGIRKMFSRFRNVKIKVEYAFGAGWGPVYRLTPKFLYMMLSKLAGWHLSIFFEK